MRISIFEQVRQDAPGIDGWLDRLGIERKRGRHFRCPVCGHPERCEISRDGNRWRCHRCHDHDEPVSGGDACDLVSAVTGTQGAELKAELESILGSGWTAPTKAIPPPDPPLYTPQFLADTWARLQQSQAVSDWLRTRGLNEPRRAHWRAFLPSSVPMGRPDIWHATKAGPVAVWALCSALPHTWGIVRNLVARPCAGFPSRDDEKPVKSKTVNKGEGSNRDDGGLWPLAYLGNVKPREGRAIVLCEGRIDAFLLEEWLPGLPVIGAYSAGDVKTLWGGMFRQHLKPSSVWMVPQIDRPDKRGLRVGLNAFQACAAELKEAGIRVRWWPWGATLKAFGMTPDSWDQSGMTDLGDLAKQQKNLATLNQLAVEWRQR